MTQLKAQAIQTALSGDWSSSITLNLEILKDNPNDIDTLNRLAFAYSSKGDLKEAKNIYQQVLSLDDHNPIALRNLKRINDGGGSKNVNIVTPVHVSNLFIEEPGKTKVIDLLNIADKKVISPLRSGEVLNLTPKRMRIFLIDQNKQYIGMLPDDIGRRLIRFIDGGNTYEAYVKSVSNNKVTIFARETKRTSKFKNQPSFISSERSKLLVVPKHNSPDNDEQPDNNQED